jgi:hypothetical protein
VVVKFKKRALVASTGVYNRMFASKLLLVPKTCSQFVVRKGVHVSLVLTGTFSDIWFVQRDANVLCRISAYFLRIAHQILHPYEAGQQS